MLINLLVISSRRSSVWQSPADSQNRCKCLSFAATSAMESDKREQDDKHGGCCRVCGVAACFLILTSLLWAKLSAWKYVLHLQLYSHLINAKLGKRHYETKPESAGENMQEDTWFPFVNTVGDKKNDSI